MKRFRWERWALIGILLTPSILHAQSIPVAFYAFLANSTTVTTGSDQPIIFDDELFDTSDSFDISNYRFQPDIAGYYQINGAVTCSNAANTTCSVSIYKNGSAYSAGNAYGAAAIKRWTVSTVVYLDGDSDYVRLLVNAGVNGSIGGGASATATYMTGFLISSGIDITVSTSTATTSIPYSPTQDEFLLIIAIIFFIGGYHFWDRLMTVSKDSYKI